MLLFLPFWRLLFREGYQDEQRNSLRIFKLTIPFGKPIYYLVIAYVTAILAIPFHDTWYADWLVFGGIVSPIFEELFARNTLTPWLKARWPLYLGVSTISSVSFALMHWGFNNAEAFALTPLQQFQKFLAHFIFGLVLCFIFRFTKSVQLLIWLHIISNLPFIIAKL